MFSAFILFVVSTCQMAYTIFIIAMRAKQSNSPEQPPLPVHFIKQKWFSVWEPPKGSRLKKEGWRLNRSFPHILYGVFFWFFLHLLVSASLIRKFQKMFVAFAKQTLFVLRNKGSYFGRVLERNMLRLHIQPKFQKSWDAVWNINQNAMQ